MIRKIVIPVRGDGKGDNVFAHAAVLAMRYKAHIAVTHCRPRSEDLMPYGIAIPSSLRKLLLSQSAGVANQVEDGMRKELTDLAAQFGINMAEGPLSNQASAQWIEEQGRQVDVIKRHGRVADLICVAKPDVDRNLGTNTLKAALFNTGRPVMMCPLRATPPETLCDKVAIAWNGSIESSRAVASTLGILEQASEVTILSGGIEVNGADSANLLSYLLARGVNAKVKKLESVNKVGKELLKYCSESEIDTLVMGAYSDSHERETFFGGNTQHVVDHAEIPVVLVH
ncbi:MAG: nucleotide-binding universal stress UspA family protein [Granulosicoccus sp.]